MIDTRNKKATQLLVRKKGERRRDACIYEVTKPFSSKELKGFLRHGLINPRWPVIFPSDPDANINLICWLAFLHSRHTSCCSLKWLFYLELLVEADDKKSPNWVYYSSLTLKTHRRKRGRTIHLMLRMNREVE